MTDRPIIFSAPMILALLDGRKTMTRRLATRIVDHGRVAPEYPGNPDFGRYERVPSPWQKVQPGDRLWVREACADEHPMAVQEGRYSQAGRAGIPGPPSVSFRTIYHADGEPLQIWRNDSGEHPYFSLERPKDDVFFKHPTISSNYTRDGKGIHWTPSIHMPRWASRLTLVVSSTKIERLQEISHEDAMAEGIAEISKDGRLLKYGIPDKDGYPGTDDHGWPWNEWRTSPADAFQYLWTKLHGPGAWEANHELVAISFRVVRANIDKVEEIST